MSISIGSITSSVTSQELTQHRVPKLLKAAADYLGLNKRELIFEFKKGLSLYDIATAQGKSIDGLKEAISSAAPKEPKIPFRQTVDEFIQNHFSLENRHNEGVEPNVPIVDIVELSLSTPSASDETMEP